MITRLGSTIEPYRSLERFNKLMSEMWSDDHSVWAPAVDIKDEDDHLIFMAELPGIDEKDVDVEINGDILTISGKREFSKEEKKEDFVRIERSYGSFERSFTLEGPVNPDEIKAVFKDGILRVVVPKTATRQSQKVAVTKA